MDLGTLIIVVLVFLVFYQVFIQLSKKKEKAGSNATDQNQLLMEKFERLDRVFKYELNDITRSLASLQALHANAPASAEVLERLDKIEAALKALAPQRGDTHNAETQNSES